MISGSLVDSVGVDIDKHCGYTLLLCYIRALVFGDVHCYYTRHGFHVEVDLMEPASENQALDIRRFLGDDPARLAVDEYRVNISGDVRRFDKTFIGRL